MNHATIEGNKIDSIEKGKHKHVAAGPKTAGNQRVCLKNEQYVRGLG